MSILIVVTSNDRLGDTGKPTGVWLEELATPDHIFRDEGAKVVLASPKGGKPPIDPRSEDHQAQTDLTKRFFKDKEALQAFENTAPLSTINPGDYGAVSYPSGHGPLWDLAEDATLDRDHRSHLRGWQACGRCLPWTGSVPPYEAARTACLSFKVNRLRAS